MTADWAKVAPNVAVVSSSGRAMGLAVVVSADGILLVHQSSVHSESMLKVTLSGPVVFDAVVVGRDPVTGLVGLQAQGWPKGARTFAYVASQDPEAKSLLIAATLAGPMQGQAANSRTAGHLGASNRFVPLTEVRFEQSSDRVAGAILFNPMGELVGVLGATLSDNGPSFSVPAPAADMAKSNSRGSSGNIRRNVNLENYGPQGVTTAYALGTTVLARVVRGLSSPSHHVLHPTLGISFRDDAKLNKVTKVDLGSTAAMGGLLVGDVIKSINGKPVQSSVELASALFELEIGSSASVVVTRDGTETELKVKVSGN